MDCNVIVDTDVSEKGNEYAFVVVTLSNGRSIRVFDTRFVNFVLINQII